VQSSNVANSALSGTPALATAKQQKGREGQVFPSKTTKKGGKMRIFLFSCENATLYNQTNPTSACF
jgi:hypothetical protein